MSSGQPVDIHQRISEFIDSDRTFAVGVILHAEGSTPGKIGGKAIIEADGKIWGTLGGGQVEAMAQEHAIDACRSKKAIVFDLAFEGIAATSETPVCGGAMRVLIDPDVRAKRDVYAAAGRAVRERKRGVMLTRICVDGEITVGNEWLTEEGVLSVQGETGDDIRTCLKKEKVQLVEADEKESILIEPVILKPVLLIAGGGHVGQAVAAQANMVGFDVIVLDDRAEFTRGELFAEGVRTTCADVCREIEGFDITEDTYIVIVTRGHRHDMEALRACIHSRAGYIGMIGSKRKVGLIRKDLVESGFASEEEFARVFAPVGMDIGAVTVPEIATSIVAQLVAVRRKGADCKISDMVRR
jgi:xanthine dehydrogenase accessory factor